MPFFAAHCAIGCVSCGSVCETRTMYGERVVMTDVAAFMITIGFFASAAIGATASAFGVSPKPARMSTLSRVMSSCARRLAMSGAAPGRVALDELDLPAAERVAVQLEVRLHPVDDLGAVVGKRAGEFRDDADLDGGCCASAPAATSESP